LEGIITLEDFSQKYERYLSIFNEYLEGYANSLRSNPTVLAESMKYSLLNGGKRIRPVIALATAEILGVSQQEILPFALALEMIHTYSLIHDDLPDMDNDDFRRGKPSNHKVFGVANAILAGDALLNQAYDICFKECVKGKKYAIASKLLCECAGAYGMIAGQSADLYYSKSQQISESELSYIHRNKTGKLLQAPFLIASILADDAYYLRFEQFGGELGVLFQITDDILDAVGDFEKLGKTVGKDEKEDKLTFVKLYGLDGARVQVDETSQRALVFLEAIDVETDFLRDLVAYIVNRSN
jgi:geranylgeranyl diphosphate synthase type II